MNHAENELRRARWRAGENLWTDGPTMLRLSRDGTQHIETSQGASVPAVVAPGLWALARRARASGGVSEAYLFRNDSEIPYRVGEFALREITATAQGDLIIGCHRLNFGELARMAQTLRLQGAEHVTLEE